VKGVLAYVALGANLGDRLSTLRQAVRRIDTAPGVHVLRGSRVYETEPVGPPQPAYLNAVIEVDACLAPHAHLATLAMIEAHFGRQRGVPLGPRTLDLDLLWQGGLVLHDERITLPHPRITERTFVLAPLADLAPELVLEGATVREWLERRGAAGATPIAEGLLA
jgi:2-amino-4-hydroxy-6-hydroxymethyldihydropteridine diphosphokinase